MGFEPTTTTLATWRSTPELLPPEGQANCKNLHGIAMNSLDAKQD